MTRPFLGTAKPEAVVPSRQQIKYRLEDEQSHATALLVLLLDQWGLEFLNWLDTSILLEAQAEFGAEIPPINLAKIRTAIGLATTDDFYMRPFWFMQQANALSNGGLNPEVLEIPSLAECAWAVVEAPLIYQDPELEQPNYSLEVLAVIRKIADLEGTEILPRNLQRLLNPIFKVEPDWSFFRTDDPDVFAMEFALQKARGRAIDQQILTELRQLRRELLALPISQDPAPLLERVDRELASLTAPEPTANS